MNIQFSRGRLNAAIAISTLVYSCSTDLFSSNGSGGGSQLPPQAETSAPTPSVSQTEAPTDPNIQNANSPNHSLETPPSNHVNIPENSVDTSDGTKTEIVIAPVITEQWVALSSTGTSIVNGTTHPGFLAELGAVAYYGGGIGLKPDPLSATKACQQLGFLEGRVAQTGRFSPVYDETMWFFNPTWQHNQSSAVDRIHVKILECKQKCTTRDGKKICQPY